MDRQKTSPEEPRYPIRVVAERTGLTPATLRAWERRYATVAPERSDGSQRLYSDADIQRLRLIARLSAIGHPLSSLSKTSTTALARMARMSPVESAVDQAASADDAYAHSTINRALSDTRDLDPVSLRVTLTRAIFKLGPLPALDAVLSPFLEQVGVAWACAELSVAQEHLASAAVREVLGWMMQTAAPREKPPVLVATTIATEQHEFGSMMSAVAAAVSGWRVLYLGPNLPGSEIARFARDADARAVALGIVMPQPTNVVRDEISALRRGLGKRTTVFAGGASAGDHRLTLRRAAIEPCDSRAAFQQALEKL